MLATLHTNDSASAMTRLVDMGIEPFLLASTVEAILAQRLLRRVCSDCRQAYEPPAALRAQIGGDSATGRAGRSIARSDVAACGQTGYRGRIGLFEFLRVTDRIRELVAAGRSVAGAAPAGGGGGIGHLARGRTRSGAGRRHDDRGGPEIYMTMLSESPAVRLSYQGWEGLYAPTKHIR